MISRGDTVRAKIYRERKNARDFLCAVIGRVELVYQDQVCIRIEGGKKKTVKAMDVEKISHGKTNE